MNTECQKFLTEWLVEGSAGAHEGDRGDAAKAKAGSPAHLSDCPGCHDSTRQLESDQSLLRAHFASLHVPQPPALELRHPLMAASGHPRRISLAILPLLLALLLLTVLAAGLLFWIIVKRVEEKDRQFQTQNEILAIEVAIRQQGLELPPGHGALKSAVTAEELAPLAQRSPPLHDPYGHPYQYKSVSGHAAIYSLGNNGRDDRGRGDDILSPRVTRN